MAILEFPPIECADDETGLLAVGGDLDVESLVLAYSTGIFPWPIGEDYPIPWFAPPKRALLFLNEFHISRSLRKELKRSSYTYGVNSDFRGIIENCAFHHGSRQGTWINNEMVSAYIKLHEAGFAHCIECYQDAELVGGLYGVSVGSVFAGESMFYLQRSASKYCLCVLADLLLKQNATWFDCQQLTPLLKSFGAREVLRDEFMDLHRIGLKNPPMLLKQERYKEL